MTRNITTHCVLIALIAMSTPMTQANVLLNAGFEAGTGADLDNWEELPGAQGTVGRSSASPHSGSSSLLITFDNTTLGTPGAYFAQQNQGANTFNTAQNYNFTFWAKVDSTDFTGQDIFFQVQWLDQDGSHGGGFKGQLQVSLTPSLTTAYQQFSFTDVDAPDDADSFLVRFQMSPGAVSGISNSFYVDDAVLEAVPEPATLGLLALGGLVMVVRRRQA